MHAGSMLQADQMMQFQQAQAAQMQQQQLLMQQQAQAGLPAAALPNGGNALAALGMQPLVMAPGGPGGMLAPAMVPPQPGMAGGAQDGGPSAAALAFHPPGTLPVHQPIIGGAPEAATNGNGGGGGGGGGGLMAVPGGVLSGMHAPVMMPPGMQPLSVPQMTPTIVSQGGSVMGGSGEVTAETVAAALVQDDQSGAPSFATLEEAESAAAVGGNTYSVNPGDAMLPTEPEAGDSTHGGVLLDDQGGQEEEEEAFDVVG